LARKGVNGTCVVEGKGVGVGLSGLGKVEKKLGGVGDESNHQLNRGKMTYKGCLMGQ